MFLYLAIHSDNTRRAVVCECERAAREVFGDEVKQIECSPDSPRRADKAVWEQPGVEFIQLLNPFPYWVRSDDTEAIEKDDSLERLSTTQKRSHKALESVIEQRDRRRSRSSSIEVTVTPVKDKETLKVVRKLPLRDTKEDLGERELMLVEEETIHRFFYPRDLWAPEGTVKSILDSEIITTLVKFKLAGRMAFRKELIEKVEYPCRNMDLDVCNEGQNPLLWVAVSRRGNNELKDQTWTAYQHMQFMHPQKKFEGVMHNALHYYIDDEKTLIASAGNMPPERILKVMVEEDVTKLNIVHEGTIVRDGFEFESDDLVMVTMTIDKGVLEAIHEVFLAQEKTEHATLMRAQETGRKSYISKMDNLF